MKILVVVDMQNDFVNGALGSEAAKAIVPNVVKKIESLNNSDYVIFTQDTHYEDYMATQEGKNLPVPHCLKNTKGWEIIDELKQYVNFDVLEKQGFGSIELSDTIDDIIIESEEPEEIELVGLCTDICVISNAIILKTFFTETLVTVDASCCAGVTPESHKTALNAMKAVQITIKNEG